MTDRLTPILLRRAEVSPGLPRLWTDRDIDVLLDHIRTQDATLAQDAVLITGYIDGIEADRAQTIKTGRGAKRAR